MAIILVTYDLMSPGQNYKPLYDYLRTFTYCKGLESVWLLDTTVSTETIMDRLKDLTDANDMTFVVRLQRSWNSWNFTCGEWLNDSSRNW